MIAEGFDNLAIGEFEQAVAFLDERDADAEDRKHAGVLDAYDAATDDDQGFGQLRQGKNLVAVDDGAAVDGDVGRVGRPGADGDDDFFGFENGIGSGALNANLMGISEAGHAMHYVNAVAGELSLGHIHFGLDDGLDAEGQVSHGDLFLDAVVHAVEGAVVVAGEMEDGLAHCLGGDGAGVDADAADDGAGFDHGHALFHLGSSYRSTLAGGSGTNDDEVIFDGAHARVSPRDQCRGSMQRKPLRGQREGGKAYNRRLSRRAAGWVS